jgi:membrane associated rhomboid family serine protease
VSERTAPARSKPALRRPEWIKVRLRNTDEFREVKGLVKGLRLNTVCEEARCPNIYECWGREKTATFMIMGDVCTRRCMFCNVTKGQPGYLDPEEPGHVADAVRALGLRHAVITQVNRDDLPDGGAEHFARTIRAIREASPECRVEVLISDLAGNWDALETILDARPEVLSHNIECVKRLYKRVRPYAVYERTLELLRRAARAKGSRILATAHQETPPHHEVLHAGGIHPPAPRGEGGGILLRGIGSTGPVFLSCRPGHRGARTTPGRLPQPRMIGVRLDGEEIWLEPEEWERWVVDGRIPPRTPVRPEGGPWVPAFRLDLYRRLLSGEPERPPSAEPSLREVLFPARGLSATEGLLLVNLLVAAVLVFALKGAYLVALHRWTDRWWYDVHAGGDYWWWVATLFLHAGPKHLFGNMVSLMAGSGAMEFLTGRGWTVAGYLITGVAGMAVSYWGHGGPPLSVGASGAIFGLLGATVAFLIRRRSVFPYRQRWKTRRVYLPLFVALFLPSLLGADYFAHAGGFLCGLVLGAFLPPHRRIRAVLEARTPPPAPVT